MLGFRALCEGPLSALLDAQQTVTQELTVRFATQSFVTRSSDSPAHEFIEGRVTRGLTLGRQINTVEGGQFGSLFESGTGPNFGEIELLNLDGALDAYVNEYYADGRQIRLKIGATEIDAQGRERVKPYSTFATVYTAIAGEWSFEHDVVRLRVRNISDRLQDRLQPLTYSGSGGRNGTADLVGRTLPIAFGECMNVTAQLVDPTILTYQLHSGPIEAVLAAYDAGIELLFDNDFTTYAELIAADISDGSYASCLAEGFIALGSPPFGAVTADIRGDNEGGYTDTHGAVIRKILLNQSNLTTDNLDEDSFTALDAAQPATMGLFLPAGDQSSIEDVIARIAFSAGAFAGQDRTGLYRVKRLDAPAAIADWSFDDRDIIAIERDRLPYTVPWKAWGVAYARNWTVQGSTDLAVGVALSRRQFLEAEARYAYVQDADIALAHRTSAGAPLRQGLFTSQTDAEDEAVRLIDFYGLNKALYRVRVKDALFSVEIGQTVRITYDRWDLGGGQNFVVMGVNDEADTVETEMLLFGGGE